MRKMVKWIVHSWREQKDEQRRGKEESENCRKESAKISFHVFSLLISNSMKDIETKDDPKLRYRESVKVDMSEQNLPDQILSHRREIFQIPAFILACIM